MFTTNAQPVSDQFYSMFTYYTLLGVVSAFVLNRFKTHRNKYTRIPNDKQWKRYFLAISGLLASGAVVVSLLLMYGLRLTLDGLNYAVNFFAPIGILMYALVVIHMITVILSIYLLVWFYHNPMTRQDEKLVRRSGW